MGSYQTEPFNTAKARYLWTGVQTPGYFLITVRGDAPNFTSGIKLVRDDEWVGGLAVKVMGWTGPLAQGTTPYNVHGSFSGSYLKEIVIIGSNKIEIIPVKEFPFTNDADLAKNAEAVG